MARVASGVEVLHFNDCSFFFFFFAPILLLIYLFVCFVFLCAIQFLLRCSCIENRALAIGST